MGKTSLVQKVMSLVDSDKVKVVYLDIFKCRTEEEFLNAFATAVIKATSNQCEARIINISKFLSRIPPKIQIGTDPINNFELRFDIAQSTVGIHEIFDLPQKIATDQNLKIVVCIDEFQQIGQFDDSLTFQKHCRSVWQHQDCVSYCLIGSKKHMMTAMFQKQDYPFFRFGEVFYLDKISRQDWIPFLTTRFAQSQKQLSETLAGELVDCVEGYSSYVQQLAWILWSSVEKVASEADLLLAMDRLMDSCQPTYIVQIEALTAKQMALLRAVAEGVEEGLTTRPILDKYRLGTSSNVMRTKEALLSRDLLDLMPDGCLKIADPVFKRWLLDRYWR